MAIVVGGANRGTFVEVNVVPLIDILLVLLVIFMVIPHKQSGLPVELPEPASPGPISPQPDPVVVQVKGDGSLRINQQLVAWEKLRFRLEEIFSRSVGPQGRHTAFIRGDGKLEFQVVARVIDTMRAAGITSVGLMTPGLEKVAETD